MAYSFQSDIGLGSWCSVFDHTAYECFFQNCMTSGERQILPRGTSCDLLRHTTYRVLLEKLQPRLHLDLSDIYKNSHIAA